MSLLETVDPGGLMEYSVVYTDRALNHMSAKFQGVMHQISAKLKKVYNASTVVIVPGSGTFAMEAVARQFAVSKKCLVIRNGWFSYRWSQIFDSGNIPAESIVMKAKAEDDSIKPAFAPASIKTVTETIKKEKPAVVFAPHVETAAGIILPDAYIKEIADATHSAGGIFVLDCIASGTIWMDMEESGVDVLISAPQKGWSGSPCCGLVMMNDKARSVMESTTSNSFACDLGKWHQIMQAYENGGHAYHTTMPTDALAKFRDVLKETESFGFDVALDRQQALGSAIRKLMENNGFKSVAAEGYKAPSVIVSYTDDSVIAKKFMDHGVQIAAGVPLQCDEPQPFQTFRIGLFGLDKLQHIERTISTFEKALKQVTVS